MSDKPRPSSVLCPSCGSLVGIRDEKCLICGRARPGLFGLTPLLRGLGEDLGFLQLVMWTCGVLFLVSLAIDIEGIGSGGFLSFLSPSGRSLLVLGASGTYPVFDLGRWWTVLSAGWLHGGVLHIVFNMMWIRQAAPATAHLYGGARMVIIYVFSSVTGFLLTSSVGYFLPFLPGPLRGGQLTIGASAALCGLVGALLWYGHRGGSSQATQYAKSFLMGAFLFGFLVPGIDNWGHIGGLAGGWLMARFLDPLRPERGDHAVVAVVCLGLSFLSIVVSVITALPAFR